MVIDGISYFLLQYLPVTCILFWGRRLLGFFFTWKLLCKNGSFYMTCSSQSNFNRNFADGNFALALYLHLEVFYTKLFLLEESEQ